MVIYRWNTIDTVLTKVNRRHDSALTDGSDVDHDLSGVSLIGRVAFLSCVLTSLLGILWCRRLFEGALYTQHCKRMNLTIGHIVYSLHFLWAIQHSCYAGEVHVCDAERYLCMLVTNSTNRTQAQTISTATNWRIRPNIYEIKWNGYVCKW